jgi:hypothetical protein
MQIASILKGALLGGLVGMVGGAVIVIITGIVRAQLVRGDELRELQQWGFWLIIVWAVGGGLIGGGCGTLGGSVGALARSGLGRTGASAVGAAVGALAATLVVLVDNIGSSDASRNESLIFVVPVALVAAVAGAIGSFVGQR